MKILVIPDVHLKDKLFRSAGKLLSQGRADRAVCLMDIPDDWKRQYDIESYIRAYDAAIDFGKAYPDTLWCYGNHDLCYLWNRRESGYSPIAAATVCSKLHKLEDTVPENNIEYIHKIDDVIFCHGGVAREFVQKYVPAEIWKDADAVVKHINTFGPSEMWQDLSPIWLRPQIRDVPMYKERTILQVVGHTPVKVIEKVFNVISCDSFSTRSDRTPIGTQEFVILDTQTWEFEKIKRKIV